MSSMKHWFRAAGTRLGLIGPVDEERLADLERRVAMIDGDLTEALAAKEQLSVALNDSEARRRELEKLLEPPAFSELSSWQENLAKATDLMADNPVGGIAAADIVPIVGIFTTVLNRLIVFRNALDRDQTGLAAALARVIRVTEGYWWVTEGRGSYEWDDERYREETATALSTVAVMAKLALVASGNLAAVVIQGREASAAAPIPTATAVTGLLIDTRRLETVLRTRWGAVAPAEAFPLLPSFDHMDPPQRAAFVRVARVVLEEALRLAGTGFDPLEAAALNIASRGDCRPAEA